MNEKEHIPVLLEEVLGYLDATREGVYIDCTIGLGGHALEILRRNPRSSIIGFDLDEKCLIRARTKLRPYADRVELYHSDFRYIPELKLNFSSVRGVLLDLGLNSFQLDSPERGFSFSLEGPLDMRLDQRNKMTAHKILHKYSESNLAQIFSQYGELKQTRKLAQRIASLRKNKKVETTAQLRQIVEEVFRWRPQKGKIHPAAKVFQALRIEVNQELKNLSLFLQRMAQLVPKKTRMVAISFHSLEDRIVKHTLAGLTKPVNNHGVIRILTKKPVTPSLEEVAANSRARSAKLRAAEKI